MRTLRHLLDRGAKANPPRPDRITVLMLAASNGQLDNTYSVRVPPGFPHATFGACQTWFGATFGATVGSTFMSNRW